MTPCSVLNSPVLLPPPPSSTDLWSLSLIRTQIGTNNSPPSNPLLRHANRLSLLSSRFHRPTITATRAAKFMATEESPSTVDTIPVSAVKLLFVEMGVGYDQHGQDVTAAAMRACRDAISSNSIPAFRRGSIPGVSFEQMKLQIKLGVPHSLQQLLDVEKWRNSEI
ncbi:uncharacterized protein LOC130778600 isoform X2 [Actinidia eriantha]|uniref:uncharacterized protein LOC130778600 isoform X2 n=1 Tax=Actinidia eriantha TaxID=165200 RepID=UPI00259100FE|nr:uncharacterized protein LOC130778600 isoform X2 [Actinidia eriantha]